VSGYLNLLKSQIFCTLVRTFRSSRRCLSQRARPTAQRSARRSTVMGSSAPMEAQERDDSETGPGSVGFAGTVTARPKTPQRSRHVLEPSANSGPIRPAVARHRVSRGRHPRELRRRAGDGRTLLRHNRLWRRDEGDEPPGRGVGLRRDPAAVASSTHRRKGTMPIWRPTPGLCRSVALRPNQRRAEDARTCGAQQAFAQSLPVTQGDHVRREELRALGVRRSHRRRGRVHRYVGCVTPACFFALDERLAWPSVRAARCRRWR